MTKFFSFVFLMCFVTIGFVGCDTTGVSEERIKTLEDNQKAIMADIKEIKQSLKGNNKRGQQAPLNVVLDVDNRKIKGDPNAPVTLVEFSDYQCPFCARHANNTYPEIVREYVDTGKVKIAFVDYALDFHKLAPKASEATHCAGDQGKYWELHNILFKHTKALQPENLPKYAQQAGVGDIDAFNECLRTNKYKYLVDSGKALAQKAGVRGTPGFHIGHSTKDNKNIKSVKSIRGAVPFNRFKAEIDAALASKDKS